MNTQSATVVKMVTLLPILFLALMFLITGMVVPKSIAHRPQNGSSALPYRFLIPESYVGWVRVDFAVPGAPALPVEEGFYIFKFPKSGRLQTSSRDVVDSRRNEFFYYSEKGKLPLRTGGPLQTRLIQEEFSGPGPGHLPPIPNRYRYIFVGPIEAFENYRAVDAKRRPRESDGYPRVGAQTWLSQEDMEKLIPQQP